MNKNSPNNDISSEQEFGWLKSLIWPIHSHEYSRLIPMLAMFFLISFIYNLLRCIKIALAVNAPGSSTIIVPFLKIGFVLPGAMIFMFIFTSFSSKYSQQRTFYYMLSVFAGFFLIFLIFLYPNLNKLEFTSFKGIMQNASFMPDSIQGFTLSIQHWPLSLFYTISELWGTVVLSTMFWGFANTVTSLDEAKRFYGLFAIGANCSSMFAGKVGQMLTIKEYHPGLMFGNTAWEQSVILHVLLVVFVIALIAYLFYWINKYGYTAEQTELLENSVKSKKGKKVTLSLASCFKYLLKSSYLLSIVTMVLSYNIVYNLSDVLWTSHVEQALHDPAEINRYMHGVTFYTGFLATVFAFILSGNLVRRYGWLVAALLTPAIWLLTTLGLFTTYSCQEICNNFFSGPGGLLLLIASVQMCLGRASKYSVFDPMKEIAFIPLSPINKIKAKAVVDGIASRLGKSGGSVILIVLASFFGAKDVAGNIEISKIIPYVQYIIFFIICCWILAVFNISRIMNDRSHDVNVESDLVDDVKKEVADNISSSRRKSSPSFS